MNDVTLLFNGASTVFTDVSCNLYYFVERSSYDGEEHKEPIVLFFENPNDEDYLFLCTLDNFDSFKSSFPSINLLEVFD